MKAQKLPTKPGWNRDVFKFILSFLLALGLTWLIQEPSFSESQRYVLFLLLFSIALWLTEAVPPFSVAIFIIVFLVFTQGYERFTSTPQDIRIYVNTFSSSVIWLMLGGFFLASAMTKTKLDVDLIQIILRVCGKNPKWILFGMMLITMTSSMLISNTATTAMVLAALMPLILQLGKESAAGKALVLGIPIAATTGGMGTMIGSPPNVIAAGALNSAGEPIDFVTWIYYGLPVAVLLTFCAWLLLVRLFVKNAAPLTMDFHTVQSEMTPSLKIERIIVMFVLVVTVLLWLTSPLHKFSAAAVSVIPLIVLTLTRVLNGENVRSMGWDTLLLVAGGLSLGLGLQQSGLLDLYAARIASLQVPHIAFFFLLAYVTMLFSNIMSNTATSTVLIPLGMAILPENRTEVAMIIGLAASTALFLPVSTPPNAIAFSSGMIDQKDLRIGGLMVGLLGPAIVVLWVLMVTKF